MTVVVSGVFSPTTKTHTSTHFCFFHVVLVVFFFFYVQGVDKVCEFVSTFFTAEYASDGKFNDNYASNMKGFCTTVGGLLVKGFFTVIRGVMKVAQEVIKVVMDAAVSVLDSLTLDQLSFSGAISDTGGGSTTRTISSTIKFTFAGKQTTLSLPLTVGLDSFETTLKGIWESIKKDVADLSNLLPKAERALVDATKVDTKGIQKVVKCIESAANGDVFGDACGTLKTVRLNTFDGLNISISQQHCPNYHKPLCFLPIALYVCTNSYMLLCFSLYHRLHLFLAGIGGIYQETFQKETNCCKSVRIRKNDVCHK